MALVRPNDVNYLLLLYSFPITVEKILFFQMMMSAAHNKKVQKSMAKFRFSYGCAEELQHYKMHNLIVRLASFTYLHWRIPENMNFLILVFFCTRKSIFEDFTEK